MLLSVATVTARQWDAVVVGAGPVGSLLAGSLAGNGASVLVLERDRSIPDQTRASTLNSRSMEIMSALGVPGLADHPRSMFGHYGGIPVSLDKIDSPWAGLWVIPQPHLVHMLREWAVDNGAVLKTGVTFTGADALSSAVVAHTATSENYESKILVGADGFDSAVRDALGFGLYRTTANRYMIRCDVKGISVARRRFERHGDMVATAGMISPEITRLMLHSPHYGPLATPTFEEVAKDWLEATGEHVDGGECVWLDKFSNACTTAEKWKVGAAFLAGDAAHDQPPVGGSSLNAGLQDVYNLVWKLTAVSGGAPEELAVTYGLERAEATARMQEEVRDQEALIFGPERQQPDSLRDLLASSESFRQLIARTIAGLDTQYLTTETGPRISPTELTHELGRPLQPYEEAALGRRAILVIGARADEVLLAIRPDGHTAGSSGNRRTGPDSAVTRWFEDFLNPVVLKAGTHV
ncbi:FAD-dependent oxidoreductase [Nocardia terpenica]|uniref:FAD-dependent oxidoreductase n=1 Tax=Nocardia terpenica TaxID=455432 RepID=UPI0031837C99